MSLRELQRAFADGVLHGAMEHAIALIESNGLAPERRLGIYRNNAIEGFAKAMQATFPVLVRLAGAEWFRQTALSYMQEHPSRSGNLHYIGASFAAYLEVQLYDSPHLYFADIARLEWAYQEVLVAADHPGFDIAALATISPEHYGLLRFSTHPALRLVESHYPILSIWKANQPDAQPTMIDLGDGPSHVLIIRRDDHVELRELPPAEFTLLKAFSEGEALEAAIEAASDIDPTFDLAASLARIVQLRALVDFTVTSPAS
jgi:hypothetical protein